MMTNATLVYGGAPPGKAPIIVRFYHPFGRWCDWRREGDGVWRRQGGIRGPCGDMLATMPSPPS